jgi:hypothetical protein
MCKHRAKPDAWPGHLVLIVTILAWLPICIAGQEVARSGDISALPPATGEALTVAPNNKPDISCSVVEWKADLPRPTLTILCPPEDVFAPLHVYLKLSWLKPEDVPPSARNVMAAAKTPTRLRTNKSATWVWLRDRGKPGGAWVVFNGVVDMALLTLPSKR